MADADSDPQRLDLYTAERVAWRQARPPRRSLADLERQARRVVECRWWDERFRHVSSPIRVYALADDARGAMASFRGDRLYFGRRCRHDFVLCHELAHVAMGSAPDHGPRFARVYLELVHFVLGRREARLLRDAFRGCGVQVAPACELEAA